MVKEGNKEVRVGAKEIEIPKEWKKYKFKSDYISKKMKAGGTPKSNNKDYYDGQIPFVKIEDMTSNGKYINYTENTITAKGLDDSSAWMVPKNSLLISMYGSYGKVAINNIELTTNQAILSIIPSKKIDLDYLYYYSSERLDGYFKSLVKATTQANLTKTIITNTPVVYPPLPEQKKIASILSSVDKSIEKTDEVIQETKELKKGLMQELFAKGIGHSEFKEVNINGKTMSLPVNWDVKMLKNVTQINKNNISTSTPEDYEIEYIDISSINNIGKIKETTFYNYGNAPSRAKRLVNIDDVIVSTVRPYLKSFSIINEDKENLVCSTGFAVLTPKSNMETEYIYYFVWSNHFVNYMRRLMRGTSYPAVNKNDVANTFIPVPPLKEQKKIASILSSVDAKIQKEEEYKAKLERLKKGLMQKLLTGEIRVNTEMEV